LKFFSLNFVNFKEEKKIAGARAPFGVFAQQRLFHLHGHWTQQGF
jgi:hypothetical protein